MIPRRALSDLLAAERGLARFDMHLAAPGRAHRHACDAARRGALAMAALDGTLVTSEDLSLALASPDEVDLPRRTAAGTAAALYRLLLALRNGLGALAAAPAEIPRDGRLRPETVAAWSSLATEARRLLAEAEAALRDEDEGWQERTRGAGEAATPPLAPWTPAWTEEIHARWYEARHGRRPLPWTAAEQEIARQALFAVDEALAVEPGVAGAARALYRLHFVSEFPAPSLPVVGGEDEKSHAIRRYIATQAEAGWWPQFARIVAPQLVARACRVDRACLPVSVYWGRDHTGYRLALADSEDEWTGWMARVVADAADAEHERLQRIEDRHATWIASTAVIPRLPKRRSDTLGPTRRQRAGTRRSTGRLPQLLDLLWEQPMVSARAVERRLGMSYRSALDLIQDLETAGVLRRATDRKLDRLWRATVL